MLSFKIAKNVEDLIEAWSTVYNQYLYLELLNPNPYKIWTFPEYLLGNSLTVSAYDNNIFIATASIVWGDDLPLDHYYPVELDALRVEKGMLVEIGLNAKVSNKVPREYILKLEAIITGIMRNSLKCTHSVAGLHPQICGVYEKRFGYVAIGEDKTYTSLNDAPVRLMYGDVKGYPPIDDIEPDEFPEFEERIILNKEIYSLDARLLAFHQVTSS